MKTAIFLMFTTAVCLVFPMSAETLNDHERIMISGDSITASMVFPSVVETYLTACSAKKDVHVFSAGHYGEQMPHFQSRMQNEISSYSPNLIILAYGINDMSGKMCDAKFTEKYSKRIAEIVRYLKFQNVRLLISSPTCRDTEYYKNTRYPAKKANAELLKLAKLNQQLAGQYQFDIADTTPLFAKVMHDAKAALGQKYVVGGFDGTHPLGNGHMIITCSILKQLGEKGDIAEIVMELNTGKTQASAGHQVISSKTGEAEIASTRYPFCFSAPNRLNEATILPYLPFQQDLNRFILKVSDPVSAKYQVSWNDKSKVFPNEPLKQGINLAAEFLENPFSEQFRKIRRYSAGKKQRERYICRTWMASLNSVAPFDPDRTLTSAIQDVLSELKKANDLDTAALQKLVIPIRHTIKVRPSL